VHDETPDSAPGAAGSTPPVTPAPATASPPINPPTEPESDGSNDPDAPADEAATNPAWANDLRKLYNAVVEEPLPDSLIALLSQLDSED
jgi:hypothetical protein